MVFFRSAFAFIFEMAGGKATDGICNILEIKPETLHQRTAFFAGSRSMMHPFRHRQEQPVIDNNHS